jgi:hypothetical protein
MPEEQRRILEMLAARHITVEQAAQLLEATAPDGIALQLPRSAGRRPRSGTSYLQYLQEMRELGFTDLSPSDVVGLKATGVDGAYLRDLRANGLNDLSATDLVALKAMGIDGAYIRQLRAKGLSDLCPSDLVALKAHGIDGAEPETNAGEEAKEGGGAPLPEE